MKKSMLIILMMVFGLASFAMAQEGLDESNSAIIPIAAFTATGDVSRLKVALNEGLNAGLTVNEIKEVLVQMYAYCGFPRSLDGLNTFMAVLKEREQKGIVDNRGREASPLAQDRTLNQLGTEIQTSLVGRPRSGPVYEFSPEIDRFLKEHLFGDIFGRDVLSFQQRELATIAALASLPAENQLRSHLNVSLNVGLTEYQLRQFVAVLRNQVGENQAERADKLLDLVLLNRQD
jgi:alkylhydroperoxidase/carboxymuconolactone decarboxylase family protein YurZ